jgi:hypothetical protein
MFQNVAKRRSLSLEKKMLAPGRTKPPEGGAPPFLELHSSLDDTVICKLLNFIRINHSNTYQIVVKEAEKASKGGAPLSWRREVRSPPTVALAPAVPWLLESPFRGEHFPCCRFPRR